MPLVPIVAELRVGGYLLPFLVLLSLLSLSFSFIHYTTSRPLFPPISFDIYHIICHIPPLPLLLRLGFSGSMHLSYDVGFAMV